MAVVRKALPFSAGVRCLSDAAGAHGSGANFDDEWFVGKWSPCPLLTKNYYSCSGGSSSVGVLMGFKAEGVLF